MEVTLAPAVVIGGSLIFPEYGAFAAPKTPVVAEYATGNTRVLVAQGSIGPATQPVPTFGPNFGNAIPQVPQY